MDCEREYAWDVELAVSKGTYIRALARDLGRALDTVAHLGALRRTRSGGCDVADAHTLEELEAAEGGVASLFCDPLTALGLPVVAIGEDDTARANNGVALDVERVGAADLADGALASVTHDGALVGVFGREGGTLKAHAIIPGTVRGAR